MDFYSLARSGLFQLQPETAHNFTLKMAAQMPQLAFPWARPLDPRLSCSVGQVNWRTPLGLAAGLDKNAVALEFFNRLGLGSMECGTVTLKPQEGNPLPRMHRYTAEASLRNSMGFPNGGAESLCAQLDTRPRSFPLGVNIGKSKNATPTEAITEYAALYEKLAPRGDWMVVNISSPNTPGLRDLQQEEWLKALLRELRPLRQKHGKEIYVKLSPDLDDEILQELATVLADQGADGLVATNTTHMPDRGVGGVSGRLLRVKAHQKRRAVLKISRDRQLPFVGVGGFEDINDVFAFWAAGGDAFQVYTAFIFQGPALLRKIEDEVLGFLNRAKLKNLSEFFYLGLPERQKLIAQFGRS